MKKKDITKELEQIQGMCTRIRSLNESLQFAEDNYDEPSMYGKEMPEEGNPEMMQGNVNQSDVENQEIESQMNDENSPINMIREIALKGMVRLCKTPEDPEYDVLKKVFTMIDKANDKKAEAQQ